jgi:hypothetical protein
VIFEPCAGKDLEGSGCCIYFKKLSGNIPGAAKENKEEPQDNRSSGQFRIRDLPNTKQNFVTT